MGVWTAVENFLLGGAELIIKESSRESGKLMWLRQNIVYGRIKLFAGKK